MDDPGSTLLAILALLTANAFLVAAEFSLIATRRIRLQDDARQGDARAARVLDALDRLEDLAFAAQFARSLATVLLGWLAVRLAWSWAPPGPDAATVSPLGVELPVPALAAAGALLAVALLHATLGQQVPKLVAIHRAEAVSTRFALPPLRALAWVLAPLLWLFGGAVRGTARLLGVRGEGFQPLVRTPDEIRMLVEEGGAATFEEGERRMIRGVFEFSETVAREVMTPRTEMVAVPLDIPLHELVDVAVREGHSRLPVYRGSPDEIVGILLVKDLLPFLREGEPEADAFDLRALMREPFFVPDTKPVNLLLAELRQQSVHLAVVVDEFGGTDGLVTMEDLLEEIVGDINDEYDVAEPDWEATPEGDVLIDGAAPIDEVNERFGLRLPEEDFDTVGGYVFGTLGRVPRVGESVAAPADAGEMRLRVERTDDRRVALVRLSALVEGEELAARGGAGA